MPTPFLLLAASRFALLPVLAVLCACNLAPVGGGRRGAAEPRPTAADPARATPTPWRTIGTSVESRPLELRTVGYGPRRALWIGGIHGDETEGSVATELLPEAFLAAGLAPLVTLTIVKDVNPDGRAARQRRNARGVDLNRNYPAKNYRPGDDRGPAALSEPEAQALHDLVLELRPEIVLVAHSWGRKASGPRAFINFDGPADRIARRFAVASGYPVVPSTDIHGTPGSLGSFVGIDLGIPILTIEYARGDDPKQCWEATRAAILGAIAPPVES